MAKAAVIRAFPKPEDKAKHRCKKRGDVSILEKACQVSSAPRDIRQDTLDSVYTEFVQEVADNMLVSFGVQAKAGYGHSVLGFGHKTTDGKRWVHVYDPENGGSTEWIEYPSGKPKYSRMEDMRVHRRLGPAPEAQEAAASSPVD